MEDQATLPLPPPPFYFVFTRHHLESTVLRAGGLCVL